MQMRMTKSLLACVLALAGPQATLLASEPEVPPGQSSSTSARVLQAGALLDGWEGDRERLAQAGRLLAETISQDARHAPAYVEYARFLMVQGYVIGNQYTPGTLEAADAALAQAIGIDPGLARAYIIRGHVHLLRERLAEARAVLEHAEALGSDDPWLQMNWGRLLLKEGRPQPAAQRFSKLISDATLPRALVIEAYQGLIEAQRASGQDDDVGEAYRALIERVPDHAWSRGNHAAYLLCARDDYRASGDEAAHALRLMDYGQARLIRAAALYRQWAQLVLDDEPEASRAVYAQALATLPASPERVFHEVCDAAVATDRVLTAMHATGLGEPQTGVEAVMRAAEAAPKAVPGMFVIRVRGGARIGGNLYLNSEPDYRDPRCLTVMVKPEALPALQARFGAQPQETLDEQVILVRGWARRVRIDFTESGRPTGKFYYQTHVVVEDADRIETMAERMQRLPTTPALPSPLEQVRT